MEPAVAAPSPADAWAASVAAPFMVAAVPPAAGTVRTIVAEDEDQEVMDIVDAMDPDLFAIFEEEAQELLPQLGGALRQWTARPDNRSARDEVLRALHTLKGSSRLAGAMRLGELAHRMESEIESLGSDRDFSTADLEPLLQRYDGLQANFDRVRAAGVGTEASPARAARRPGRSRAALHKPCPRKHRRAQRPKAPGKRRDATLSPDRPSRRWRRNAPPATRRCGFARSCWTGWSTRPAK